MNRQDEIDAKSQAELQKLIEEIKSGEVQVTDLKDLRRNVNDRLRKVDPSAVGKRAVKTINAMTALKEIKKQGKDLKQVQWGNSIESAKYVLDKDETLPENKRRFKGWKAVQEDLDGDQYMDTIVKDGAGNPRIINGWTVTKTKYPERNLYTKKHPRSEDRRGIRDEDGEIINEGKFTKFGDFKKANRELTEPDADGNVVYKNKEYAAIKKPLTPYQKFTKVVLDPFWAWYKQDIPKSRRMNAYGKIKKLIWDELKFQIYKEDLGIPIPQSEAQRVDIEKQNRFKTALDTRVTNLVKAGPNNNIPLFRNFIEESFNAEYDPGSQPQRYYVPGDEEFYE